MSGGPCALPLDIVVTHLFDPASNVQYSGADDRNRTGDLVLTKDVLYRLSYVGGLNGAGSGNRTHVISLEG